MKPCGALPKMSVVSPVATTVRVKLTRRHVPYNSSSPARALIEVRRTNAPTTIAVFMISLPVNKGCRMPTNVRYQARRYDAGKALRLCSTRPLHAMLGRSREREQSSDLYPGKNASSNTPVEVYGGCPGCGYGECISLQAVKPNLLGPDPGLIPGYIDFRDPATILQTIDS